MDTNRQPDTCIAKEQHPGRNRTKRDHDTIIAAAHEKRLKSSVVWITKEPSHAMKCLVRKQQESGQRTRLASTSGTIPQLRHAVTTVGASSVITIERQGDQAIRVRTSRPKRTLSIPCWREDHSTHLAAWTGVLDTCTFALRKLPSEPLLQRRFGGTWCCTAQEQRRTSQNSPRRTQMPMSTPEQSAKCLGWSRSLREQRLMGRRADVTLRNHSIGHW